MLRLSFYSLYLLSLVTVGMSLLPLKGVTAEEIRLGGIEQGDNCTVIKEDTNKTPLLNIANMEQIAQSCSQIANRLQAEINKSNLEDLILIADTIGRRWKICMVRNANSRCKNSNVLLDFPPEAESNPQQFLSSILDINTVIELNGFEGQQTPRKPYSKFGEAIKRAKR